MRKLSDKQRSAREKYYEMLYKQEHAKYEEEYNKNKETQDSLQKANIRIKELEYLQSLKPEDIEEIKNGVKKIKEFKDSKVGNFIESIKPFLPMMHDCIDCSNKK